MNIYLISRKDHADWDTYDSAVVFALTEEQARQTHPDPNVKVIDWGGKLGTWAYTPDQVTVEYLGIAKEGTEAGVACASFNAG